MIRTKVRLQSTLQGQGMADKVDKERAKVIALEILV